MSERSGNSTFRNIQLAPPSNPSDGDGLLYIGDKPLLVYDASKSGWFINQVGLSGASVEATPQSTGNGPSQNEGGTGLSRQTYNMESLRKLATSDILTTSMNKTVKPNKKTFPNRHEQYTNMGVVAEVRNVKGAKQQLRKGDVLIAVDDMLFNSTDEMELSNYVVGWSEVKETSDKVLALVYTGNKNSHKISYKLYNSANKTLYNLACPSECEMFNENGYGLPSKPLRLQIKDKANVSNSSNSTINKIVTRQHVVKQHVALPDVTKNFNFNYSKFEYSSTITLDIKYSYNSVFREGDIVIAKSKDGELRGLTTLVQEQARNSNGELLFWNNSTGDSIANLTNDGSGNPVNQSNKPASIDVLQPLLDGDGVHDRNINGDLLYVRVPVYAQVPVKDVNGHPDSSNLIPKISCNFMVYSNDRVEPDIRFFLIRKDNDPVLETTIFTTENTMYDLEADYTFINNEYTKTFSYDLRRSRKLLSDQWVWFSNTRSNKLYKGSNDRNLIDVLGDAAANVVKIKTQEGFSIREKNTDGSYKPNWVGSVHNVPLPPHKMCKLYLTAGTEWIYDAYPIIGDVPLDLSEGWNWIGFPSYSKRSLSASLESVLNRSSYIKGITDFANIDATGSPDNNFNMMPGEGYKLNVTPGNLVEGTFSLHNATPDIGTIFPVVPSGKEFTLSHVVDSKTNLSVVDENADDAFTGDSTFNQSQNKFTLRKNNYIFGEYVIDQTKTEAWHFSNSVSDADDTSWIELNKNIPKLDSDGNQMTDVNGNTIMMPPMTVSINGTDRPLTHFKVLEGGYIITDNEVNDMTFLVDFKVQFTGGDEYNTNDNNQESKNEAGEGEQTDILSKVHGIGPVRFNTGIGYVKDQNFDNNGDYVSIGNSADISSLTDIMRQNITNNHLDFRSTNGDVLMSVDPDLSSQYFIDSDYRYQSLGAKWSIWFSDTQPDLVFTYDKRRQVVVIPSMQNVTGVDLDPSQQSISLGTEWKIVHKTEGIYFYAKDDSNPSKYVLQMGIEV